jgi:hypothetical protein
MGAVDLVIQVESPASVASGLQRVGRAGHQVGEPSRGVFFPKYRGDLLETAVVTARMHEGAIEETKLPRNPLDVLAQQIVAMTVREAVAGRRAVRDGAAGGAVREPDPRRLRGGAGHAGRRVSVRRVRGAQGAVVWDRETAGSRAARRADGGDHQRRHDPGPRAVSGVPGRRGGDAGRRVGELDEEMVYESRVGEVIALGATSWRVEEIGRIESSSRRRPACRARSRSGTATAGPADRTGAGAGRVRPRARRRPGRRRARADRAREAAPGAPRPGRAGGRERPRLPRPTSARRPARCRPTAGSSSSGSATSWATGGSSS